VSGPASVEDSRPVEGLPASPLTAAAEAGPLLRTPRPSPANPLGASWVCLESGSAAAAAIHTAHDHQTLVEISRGSGDPRGDPLQTLCRPSADPLQTLCYIRICAESNTLPSGVWRGVDVHPPFLFVGLAMLLYFAPRKARACTSTARGSAEANVPPLESLQRVCRGSAEGLRRVCRAPLQRAAEPPPHAAEGTLCTLQSPPCALQRVPSARCRAPLAARRGYPRRDFGLTSPQKTNILERSTPCPRSDSPARYILANIGRICGLHTRPSYSHRADHPHRAGGRALERSDIAKRRLRMVHGAIGLWRARVPPHSVLIWRTLPSAEAANHLPSAVSSLPPHTHRTCTLLSCASFASPRCRNER